ncbi:MAG: hypothetical protein V2I36_18680 [Desulfopila sp.]|jgi:hypothetical protein|nr:hypothetical protein [Desulfopila sp.]
MKKQYTLHLDLPCQESFEIIEKSGNEIDNWKAIATDHEKGCIEWQQSFWSLGGFVKITAVLQEKDKQHTLVTISVFRPIQIWDPGRMCERIFRRLERKIIEKTEHAIAELHRSELDDLPE